MQRDNDDSHVGRDPVDRARECLLVFPPPPITEEEGEGQKKKVDFPL